MLNRTCLSPISWSPRIVGVGISEVEATSTFMPIERRARADRRWAQRRDRDPVDGPGPRIPFLASRGLQQSMSRNKVTVIGAGNVGATTAQRIAEAGGG